MYEVNATIDCKQAIDEYIGNTDWRVRANSNTTYSNAGLVNNTAGKIAAKYWLSEVYSPEEGKAHIEGDYHIHDLDCMTAYCFTGDTKVVLLDGTTPSFKELTERYKNGEYFWVVSRDKQGNIVPGKAHHPRLIKHNAELMEITISGGAKIVCTPDHEFMLRDGSYRQAKDLRSRESLMPYYSNTQGRGYIFINDSKLGIKDYLHRLVGKWKSGVQDLAGYAVHHINGDKKDNRPENIEVLCDKEHRALELRNTMQSAVWQKANNTRLQEYNRSEEKRSAISKLAQQRNRNEKGQFYNHTVVSKKYLDYTEDVYCLTVDEHENFALEAGVFVHNCAGWNLRSLLAEGFNGVRSRVNSKPPRHLREALGQMANFLGILQSEWAGAQAFSSFDTFLAPYVFKDKMSFKNLKKAIRSFVYNLNVPSRWGQCVKEEYKCLRGDGKWVTHNELKPGDEIYVVDPATGVLKKDVLTHVNVFDAPEKMHRYYNKQGFNFEVTDNHRVIYKTGSNGFSIKPSSELINRNSPIDIPISTWGAQTPNDFFGNEYDIDDELLEFITFIMCDGCIVHQEGKTNRLEFYKSPTRYGCDRFEELCNILKIKYSKKLTQSATFKTPITVYRLHNNAEVAKVIELLDADKHKTPEFVQYLSPRQCYIMLDRWVTLDGHFDGSHWKMQADTESIQEMLAFLAVRAGKAAALQQRYIGENKTATKYTTVYKRGCRSCRVKEVESSTKKVWCPTTNTGTFVCMTDDGYIFLTGNSPFTNITIDWTVPDDLKEDMPLCGAEHLLYGINDSELTAKAKERGVDVLHNMTYKHFQQEMNMIQKAYYEVMTEGDSTGQPFTFPIPTVNITEEFDWEGENVLTLFENAAKIGSSYFQNFVGSQYKLDENGNRVEDEEAYKPSAVRSMCPLERNEKVIVRSRWDAMFAPIGEVYKRYCKGAKYECFYNGEWIPAKVVKVLPQKLYYITLANNSVYKMGAEHEQPILRDGQKLLVSAKDIIPGDMIPFNTSVIDANLINSSYELGYAVGAYLGDGSKDGYGINYSIAAASKADATENTLKKFWEGMGYRVSVTVNNNCRSIRVGAGSYDVIKKYFSGDSALSKSIAPTILSQSVEMRKGLIDGYLATDGDRTKSRIWTSSKTMVEDLIAIFNSIGIKAYCSFEDTRDGRLGTNACYAVSYIKDRANYKGKYTTVDGQLYWLVTNVEEKNNRKPLYCLATDSEHHLFTLKDGLITHNCRLQLDLNELRKRGNGLFGSAESTGSVGVVTINLARLGYRFKGDKEGLYKELDRLMDLAKSTLEKKRVFVTDMYNRGLYPYTKRYLPAGFRNHFSTIGVNGGNEMIRNFTNDEYDITTEWGRQFAEDLLNHIRNRMREFQNETGNLYNLEASPGEGATHRFAREDIKRYPDIIQAGCKEKGQIYYTNSTQLPAWYTEDLFMALKLQDKLQTRYTGGTVFHMYMSEMISSPEACRDIVRKVLTHFKMPYITVTPLFSVCDKHGYLKGRHDFCPLCDEEILAKARQES